MVGKPKFHELAVWAKGGDGEALIQLYYRLTPAIKKYSRWSSRSNHQVDCYSELVIWLLQAIHKYPG